MEINSTDTVRREVEIDTKLASLWEAEAKIESSLDSNRVSLAHSLSIRAEYHGRSRTPYFPAWAELQEKAQDKLRSGQYAGSYVEREIREKLAKHDTLIAQHGAIRDQAAPLEAIYRAEQWSRFFIVQNNNGHIHSSMECSTCNRQTSERTRFGWLPNLSGLNEADAVEAHGMILCSVCFPSAPVEWTNGVSKVDQATKAARAAEKAEKDAAKAAKAITDIDGSPLRSIYGTIKTEISARRELSSALFNVLLGYGDNYNVLAERIAAAIAHKTGENAAELLKVGREKAAKKYAKEVG